MKTHAISSALGRQVREAAADLTWERLPESMLMVLLRLRDAEALGGAARARYARPCPASAPRAHTNGCGQSWARSVVPWILRATRAARFRQNLAA